ncbi:MAG TPA: methyltransferase domain-containing protein [Myxococcota bacterium]
MSEQPEARAFFRSAVVEYDRAHYSARSFMTVRLARVLECVDALALPPGARVLECGCGPGHLVAALLARGFQVVAIDTSSAMLALTRERARASHAGPPPRLQLASLEQLPHRDASFDLVLSTGVIEYLPGDATALREMGRVLRPGGHLVLSVTNAWSPIFVAEFAIEFLKRRAALLGAFNALWTRLGRPPVRARHFPVRRHRPGRLREAFAAAGFKLEDGVYFHFLPWPHPLDQLFPRLSARLGAPLERFGRGPLGVLGEGYLAVGEKPRG